MKQDLQQNKKAWPTQKVMTQIYDQNLWGGNKGEYYSGEGSHNPMIVEPYVAAVSSFLNSFPEPISVCDLGCGDFNVGQKLLPFTQKYIGVDIVEGLIEKNRTTYKHSNLIFEQIDISKEPLPKSDCVFIRQVLQHLSNREIQHVLNNLTGYKYVVLTEHLPHGSFAPNIDKVASLGIRLNKNSGVDITKAPFNFKFKKCEEILTVDSVNWKGRISTKLIQL